MALRIARMVRPILALLAATLIPTAFGGAKPNRAEQILANAESEAVSQSRHSLDAALRLLALNDSRAQPEAPATAAVSDALGAILCTPDRKYLPGETVQQALIRWLDPPPVTDRPCNNSFRFEPLRTKYHDLTGQDWPLEWRTNDRFWRDFAVDLLESPFAKDPAALWRRRIADDPRRTELFRLAYLEAVRSFERPVDRELIEPLLIEGQSISAFDRLVLVRSALSRQAGLVGWRVRLDARILEWLTKPDVPSLPPEVVRHLRRWSYEMPERTRQELVRTVVDRLHVSKAEPLLPVLQATNRAFLSKSTRVGYRGMSVNRALTELAAQVALPVWFDDEVLGDESPLQLDARGTWFRVLEDVLTATPYRAAVLDRNIIWVGRPEAQEQAAAFVARALSKWPTDSLPPAACDFVASRWDDCLVELSQSTETPIVAPWIAEQPQECRFTCGRLPMAVSLELLTRHERLDWLQMDGTVVVMPRSRSASVRHALDRHRLRNEFAEAEYHARPLWKQLQTPSNSFDRTWSEIEQSAREIELNLVIPFESAEIVVPRTCTMEQIPWSTLLTVAQFETDLDWDTDGVLVFAGTNRQVAAFRRRTDRRAERRGRTSADIASRLSGHVDVTFDAADRAEIVAWFREIGVSPIPDFAPQALTMHLKDVPLEAALDVLTLQLGLDWFVGKIGIQVQ